MRSYIDIYCSIGMPPYGFDDTFYGGKISSAVFVTHGPEFVLWEDDKSLPQALVDGYICNYETDWLQESPGVKSIDLPPATSGPGIKVYTAVDRPLKIDRDHTQLSAGVYIFGEGEESHYWAGVRWDLSGFYDDRQWELFSYIEQSADLYKLVTVSGEICNMDELVTLIRPENTTGLPTVTCSAYHWMDKKVEDAQRTTTIVSAVSGTCLGIALIVIAYLLVRGKKTTNKVEQEKVEMNETSA